VLDLFNEQERLDQINPSHNRFVFLCLIKTCSARPAIDDDGDYVMKTPLLREFDSAHLLSNSSVMAVVGMGSRSSPIVIDDDDDDVPIPPKAKANSSSSSLVKGTPPQPSTPADIAPARDTTPARQENPDQLRSGKGYSMLVRMGYKPGYGLGVNLEGIRTLSSFLLGG
jgi:hypothetical protein